MKMFRNENIAELTSALIKHAAKDGEDFGGPSGVLNYTPAAWSEVCFNPTSISITFGEKAFDITNQIMLCAKTGTAITNTEAAEEFLFILLRDWIRDPETDFNWSDSWIIFPHDVALMEAETESEDAPQH